MGRRLKARRGSRLAALTSGGAIPDNASYEVVLEPDETTIGSLDEDFAIESMAGDVILLGNSSWRIRRIESGRVRVEDAQGAPSTIPFWLGEGPARTVELSAELSAVRQGVADRLHDPDTATAWGRARPTNQPAASPRRAAPAQYARGLAAPRSFQRASCPASVLQDRVLSQQDVTNQCWPPSRPSPTAGPAQAAVD